MGGSGFVDGDDVQAGVGARATCGRRVGVGEGAVGGAWPVSVKEQWW